MVSSTTNTHQWVDLAPGQRVNVTTRNEIMFGPVDRTPRLTTMTINTIRLWKSLVNAVIDGKRFLEGERPDNTLAPDLPGKEPLVTVWGKFDLHGDEITITVHCDTNPQQALDTAWANIDACNKVREALKAATKPAEPAPKTDISPAPAPTPPAAQQTLDIGQIRHVGTLDKKAQFVDGELVSFDIAKIEMEEVNGLKKWKVYNFFGSKAGRYPAGGLTVYGDNDLSMKAVGAMLNDLKLQPGGATEGRWKMVYRVKQTTERTNFYPVQLAS